MAIIVAKYGFKMKMETLSLRDKLHILLEKRPSGVAGLRYTILYGKSQVKNTAMKEELRWHKKMTSTIPNAKANYIANIFATLFPKVFI